MIYGLTQLGESYVVTPMLQERATRLQPVVLIGFQVLMGTTFGVPGVIVAAPLLVVVDVLVRRVWRADMLKDPEAESGP